ncbi:MAG: autotransporter outer membrane beta-barrel domain-containing protein, partial [Beijerinckiaceae bacterium]
AAQGLTLGVAGAYSRSNVSAEGLNGTSTSYLGAVYGSYTKGGFEADLMAGLSHSEFRTTRTFDIGGARTTAASAGKGTGFLANAEIGYRYALASAPAFLKPFVGLSHGGMNRAAFSETGAGALGLSFPSQRFGVTQARAGMTFGATFAGANGLALMPELSLAWGRDLSDTTSAYRAAIAGQPMRLIAAAPGRDAFLARAQLTAGFGPNMRIFAAYDGEFRANQITHRLDGGLRVFW